MARTYHWRCPACGLVARQLVLNSGSSHLAAVRHDLEVHARVPTATFGWDDDGLTVDLRLTSSGWLEHVASPLHAPNHDRST
jgi:hypothetical protein